MKIGLIILCFAFIFLAVIGFGLLLLEHELSHVAIFSYYDINSSVSAFPFPHAYALNNNTENCKDACKISHGIADGFLYPMIAVYALIAIGFASILISILGIINHLENKIETKPEEIKNGD